MESAAPHSAAPRERDAKTSWTTPTQQAPRANEKKKSTSKQVGKWQLSSWKPHPEQRQQSGGTPGNGQLPPRSQGWTQHLKPQLFKLPSKGPQALKASKARVHKTHKTTANKEGVVPGLARIHCGPTHTHTHTQHKCRSRRRKCSSPGLSLKRSVCSP